MWTGGTERRRRDTPLNPPIHPSTHQNSHIRIQIRIHLSIHPVHHPSASLLALPPEHPYSHQIPVPNTMVHPYSCTQYSPHWVFLLDTLIALPVILHGFAIVPEKGVRREQEGVRERSEKEKEEREETHMHVHVCELTTAVHQFKKSFLHIQIQIHACLVLPWEYKGYKGRRYACCHLSDPNTVQRVMRNT